MKNVLRNRAKFGAVVENYNGITTKLKTLPNGNSSGHATGDWGTTSFLNASYFPKTAVRAIQRVNNHSIGTVIKKLNRE